ncbi:hypothetical protein LJR084_007483 [Variovorax sp. LjRoot84]|uniref:hypothetical protein n=1 Tax=Variovorax sp. LjRoot84 TaxID=3342340 RepID=UPI003ECF9FE1
MTKRNLLLLLVQAGGLAEMMLCNAAAAAGLRNTTQLLICLHLLDATGHHTQRATASELAIRMRTPADRVRKQANALLASGHIRRLTDDDRMHGDCHDLRKRPYVLTQQGSCAAARGLHAAKEIDAIFAALMPTHLAAGLVTFDAWSKLRYGAQCSTPLIPSRRRLIQVA